MKIGHHKKTLRWSEATESQMREKVRLMSDTGLALTGRYRPNHNVPADVVRSKLTCAY